MSAFGLNNYQFIGRISQAKTITNVENPFVAINVAVDADYLTKEGGKVERTDFIEVTVNGTSQEDNLSVGRLVLVQGRPTATAFSDKEGNPKAAIAVKGAIVSYLDAKPVAA